MTRLLLSAVVGISTQPTLFLWPLFMGPFVNLDRDAFIMKQLVG